MEKRSLLRVLLRMSNPDEAVERSSWRRLPGFIFFFVTFQY